jgi:hypothetical protein
VRRTAVHPHWWSDSKYGFATEEDCTDFSLQTFDMTQAVAGGRRWSLLFRSALLCGEGCRDMSRTVVSRRDVVAGGEFLDLGDVTRDGLRRHEIDLAPKCRLFFLAVEMTFGTVPLQATNGARMTGSLVEVSDLFDGQDVVGVEGCRDRS